MNSTFKILVATLVAANMLLGCSATNESEEQATTKPISVDFKGKPDPAYVGKWKTADASSELDLNDNGALILITTTPGHPGPPNSKNGKWLVDGSRLLIQYSNPDGSQQTLSYAAKLTGTKLILSTKIPKRDTTYSKI